MESETWFKKRRDEMNAVRPAIDKNFVSQHSIAKVLDCTPALVGVWERGEAVPGIEWADQLAIAYRVKADVIVAAILDAARAKTAAATA